MTPRQHQTLMLEATERGWREFRRQLVVCPTGGGKTPFFAWEAQKHFPHRTLIIAHRKELLEQAIDKVFQATGIRAELDKAESRASINAQIVVGSIQTLCREARLTAWPEDHFGLVVVDEAHHTTSDSYRRVLARFDKHARVLGVTATPKRSDARDLGEYFENIACQIPLYTRADNPIPGLINTGMLVPISVYQSPIKIDIRNVGMAMDAESGCRDFSKADSATALEPYLLEIAREIKAKASDRRVLGFAPLIDTARKASEACAAVGLKSEYIYGEDPNRDEKQRRFANWDYDILWNAQLLTEGYDDPGIDCIVPLRPTRSAGFYCQQIGRGLRLDPPKRDLLIIDFLWLSARHDLCRPASLIAQTEEEAQAITQIAEQQSAAMPADVAEQLPMDLQDLANSATAQREANLRKKLEEHQHKKGKFISSEEFAIAHNNLDVAEFEPAMQWESKTITDGQARALKRAKIDIETVRGRGHASRLIDLIVRESKLKMASLSQRQLMRQMGCENADHATEYEARQFFAKLRN